MVQTLITDEFDEPSRSLDEPVAVEPHILVYGALGYTDDLSQEVIDELLGIGAITLERTHSGPGWKTLVYVTAKGNPPK